MRLPETLNKFSNRIGIISDALMTIYGTSGSIIRPIVLCPRLQLMITQGEDRSGLGGSVLTLGDYELLAGTYWFDN